MHVPKLKLLLLSSFLELLWVLLSLQLRFAAAQAGRKEGTKYRWSAWKPPKPWLTSADVYSLCSEKLLASSTCQESGIPHPCVSAPELGTQSSADKHTQLSGHFCSDPGTLSDFWILL